VAIGQEQRYANIQRILFNAVNGSTEAMRESSVIACRSTAPNEDLGKRRRKMTDCMYIT
jgi:hypothetical protein